MICCVKEYSIEEVMEEQYKMSVETRILFTDLDGTLLNDHKEVTSGNQVAIDEALACGHKIVVCTGVLWRVRVSVRQKPDWIKKAAM